MDILPDSVIRTTAFAFKAIFLISSGVIVILTYFEAKEAKKMEDKFSIEMPGVATFAISIQLILSIAFLILSTLVFLFV